jgi:hypothetical protein
MGVVLPSITVACGEAHEAVRKAVLVDESAQLAAQVWRIAHCPIPVSHNGLRDERSEVVIISPADSLDGYCDMRCRNGVVSHPHFRTNEIGLALLFRRDLRSIRCGRSRGEASEMLFGELDQVVVRYTPGADQYHTISSIVCLDVTKQVFSLNASDVLFGSKNCSAKGLVLVGCSVEMVEDDLVELLVHLLLFTKYDVPLSLDRCRLQFRILKDIGKDVDSPGNIGVEGFGIVDCVFALQPVSKTVSILLC